MRPFSASDLLSVWERGMDRPPADKALILLRAAFPDAPPMELSNLSIGQRDLCLLGLRELTFGSHMSGLAACPECKEKVEVDFDIRDVVPETTRIPDLDKAFKSSNEVRLDLPEWKIRFRLPNNTDMMSASASEIQTPMDLLAACLLEVQHNGRQAGKDDLTEEVVETIAEQMIQRDPYISISMGLKCPSCGHEWPMILDILSYFMSEINNWAMRILHVVHHLASAYGWSESDILTMSAWRRQKYLELTGNG